MIRANAAALLVICGFAGCSPTVPQQPILVPHGKLSTNSFDRAYSLTENQDATIRVFARESGDETWLFEMRREGDGWTEPRKLDFPARRTLTGPSFSAEDGALYFSSDAEIPSQPGRKDLNLWRAEVRGDGWGEPEPLSGDVNTGANENMAAISRDGLMVFVSNHSRMGGGGYDLGEARRDGNGDWLLVRTLRELNDSRANDHVALSANGQTLFFYSHREPKLGAVDIWSSMRTPSGDWSEPFNPGAPLNSSGMDYGAGVSGDGANLFLSRDGILFEVPIERLGIQN